MTLKCFLENGGDLKELKNSKVILVYDSEIGLYTVQKPKEIRHRVSNTYFIENGRERKTILGGDIEYQPISVATDKEMFILEKKATFALTMKEPLLCRVIITTEPILPLKTESFEFFGFYFHRVD